MCHPRPLAKRTCLRFISSHDSLASPSVTFGVSFFAVFLGHSLCTKEKEFCCLQGRSEGLFRKMTLVFPCFAVYATYEQVSLSGFQGTPWCSRNTQTKNDTLKMTLGRARDSWWHKPLVAPYRAILRYYRCDTPYCAILLDRI